MTIPALPLAPNTSRPATFAPEMDEFLPALDAWGAAANALGAQMASDALVAASGAAAAIVGLAAANFKGTYASRTGAAAVPYSVSHVGHFWMLVSNLADITTSVPGVDPEWQMIAATPWIRKTGTYTASSGDRIKASTAGGAWNLIFPPAPSDGDEIEVLDVDGTFHSSKLTLLANGKKIMGYTTSFDLDLRYTHLVFVYDSTLGDWRL